MQERKRVRQQRESSQFRGCYQEVTTVGQQELIQRRNSDSHSQYIQDKGLKVISTKGCGPELFTHELHQLVCQRSPRGIILWHLWPDKHMEEENSSKEKQMLATGSVSSIHLKQRGQTYAAVVLMASTVTGTLIGNCLIHLFCAESFSGY